MSALPRGLDILEALAGRPRPAALGEIADALALPKSATHRLLTELMERGFVRQEPDTQAYALTLKLAALGVQHLSVSRILDVCQPVIERLAQASGELVRMTVAEGGGLYWVARAQGAQAGLRYDPEQGTRVHLHVTAVGKVWLATLEEDAAVRLATSASGFGAAGRFGPRALTTEAQLRAALARTRARGFGQAVDEGEPGASAMACAIHAGGLAQAVGTVSIAGPTARLTPARMQALLAPLKDAAAELGRLWPLRRYLAEPPRLDRVA